MLLILVNSLARISFRRSRRSKRDRATPFDTAVKVRPSMAAVKTAAVPMKNFRSRADSCTSLVVPAPWGTTSIVQRRVAMNLSSVSVSLDIPIIGL